MKCSAKILVLIGCLVVPMSVFAGVLSGSVSVHQVSDTAANAKIMAMNSANRQIMLNVLSKYADSDALSDLIQTTSDDDLLNFISSSSVSNEQISDSAYSAKITVNLDNDAIKNWLTQNNVQNWVPVAESASRFTLSIVVPNGIADWAELKRIARENNVEIETQNITGNNIIAKMPSGIRTKFTADLHANGWKYADNGGVLQIWK